jgi:uncharacterized membrane protein
MPDISFQCPNCNVSLNTPREMANQLMECPDCKQTIEIPIRDRRPTPDFTKIGASASKDESLFFQNGDIMVTNARFVVGARTFAMRGITSVEDVKSEEVVERESDKSLANAISAIIGFVALLVILGGFYCWILYEFSFWVVVAAIVIAIVMFIIAGSLMTQTKQAFKIVLKTAGGDVVAYSSFDRGYISEIAKAINDSIVSHG